MHADSLFLDCGRHVVAGLVGGDGWFDIGIGSVQSGDLSNLYLVGDLFLGAFVVVFVWKYWVYRRSRNQSGPDDAAADASREARFEALRRAADAAEAELAQRESQAQKPSEPRA